MSLSGLAEMKLTTGECLGGGGGGAIYSNSEILNFSLKSVLCTIFTNMDWNIIILV